MPVSIQAIPEKAHSLTIGEGFVDPVGFHDATPTFSWKLPVTVRKQTAYQIQVRDDISSSIVWDSGWEISDQSVLVAYDGQSLESRQQLSWMVRIRDEEENTSHWSDPAFFELGLLSSSDWDGKWIRAKIDGDPVIEQVTWLRKSFSSSRNIKLARLYVTAKGMFDVAINGDKVSEDYFANGWTSYLNRIHSLTYDVTKQLKTGRNSLRVRLGRGWFAGRIGWKDQSLFYGNEPELLLQLEVTYTDGSTDVIHSDRTWKSTHAGPILSSSIYDGETYDARIKPGGWETVAVSESIGSATISPKPFAPVRAIETLKVKEITEPEPGRFVFDLGQNMVGLAKIRIPVKKDETITLRFAEMLNQDGTMYTDNYRTAKSTDYYTAAKDGVIEWEPSFTFHGFRYVELSGLENGVVPKRNWVKGIVLHSDLRKIGKFESSHEMLNQLQSNIIWGQRGNFLDIPTDCPQRDERLGWTGDAQAFCPTSMFNYDCHAFWKSWLASMRDDQFEGGNIPNVIPDVLGNGQSPGWMDAATIIPWEAYVRTADKEFLSENLDMMEKLVSHYRSLSIDGLIPKITAFGDWLQPYAEKNFGDTPKPFLGTAFYALSTQILSDSAAVLGEDSKARKYAEEANRVRDAFTNHYFDNEGKLTYSPETQTGYLLAMAFDLIPEQLQKKAVPHLLKLIDEAGGHLRTGFLGTPFINRILDEMGHSELAHSILFKETYPSWFYSIHQGSTTMWERWNSYSHEDGFGEVSMNSFNHYAYGAIGQWMYERMAGLAPDPEQPGYKHFFIRPVISDQLDWVRVELDTPYGKAVSGWKKDGKKVIIECTVPPNTTATVEFPDGRPSKLVGPGTHKF